MSHELRTPLNAILGFSEMMQAQVFGALGSERYVEYCEHIRGSGEKLLAVITDVLDMSRLDAGQMEIERAIFPITDVLVDSLRGIAALAAKSVSPSTRRLRRRSCATAIRRRSRAPSRRCCAMPSNSRRRTGGSSVRLREAGAKCIVTIADTGCGVPADCIERIGRPFEQFAPHMQDGMKGSGLGLAIASSLIKLHGGDLRIRSTEGRGTVVRIRLPVDGGLTSRRRAAEQISLKRGSHESPMLPDRIVERSGVRETGSRRDQSPDIRRRTHSERRPEEARAVCICTTSE